MAGMGPAVLRQCLPAHASKLADWVVSAARLFSAHCPNSLEQNEQRPRTRCRTILHVPTRLSPYRCSGEYKLIVPAARIRVAGAAGGPRGTGGTARAHRCRGARPRRCPAWRMSTDRGSSASSQGADKAARGSPRPSKPAAQALPAYPERPESGTPRPVSRSHAGKIVTQAALDSMIAESWTSQLRRPPWPRRFVVIYRRRQAKVVEGTDATWSQ